jgi:hypothetical protein
MVDLFPATMIFEGSGRLEGGGRIRDTCRLGVAGRLPQARHGTICIVEVAHDNDLSQRIIPQQRINSRLKNVQRRHSPPVRRSRTAPHRRQMHDEHVQRISHALTIGV